MSVLMVANHKGGAGKTVTTQALVAELASRGHTVLALDMDPQGNLSRRMGYSEAELESKLTMAEVIQYAKPEALQESFLDCRWDTDYASRIKLAPSRIELENRIAEAGTVGAPFRLRKVLAPFVGQIDYIVGDCAPSLGHLFQMLLVASDGAIGTSVPEYDHVRGIFRLHEFIENAENREALRLPDHTRLRGVIVTAKRNTKIHDDRLRTLTNAFGDGVWATIPLRTSITDSQERAVAPQMLLRGAEGDEIRGVYKAIGDRTVEAFPPGKVGE